MFILNATRGSLFILVFSIYFNINAQSNTVIEQSPQEQTKTEKHV